MLEIIIKIIKITLLILKILKVIQSYELLKDIITSGKFIFV